MFITSPHFPRLHLLSLSSLSPLLSPSSLVPWVFRCLASVSVVSCCRFFLCFELLLLVAAVLLSPVATVLLSQVAAWLSLLVLLFLVSGQFSLFLLIFSVTQAVAE